MPSVYSNTAAQGCWERNVKLGAFWIGSLVKFVCLTAYIILANAVLCCCNKKVK